MAAPSGPRPQGFVRGVTANTPLPPSVEKAYYKKCIELKRRINEIEDNNDAARLRKIRINRAILKMRLERAMLLEQLQRRMEHNVDESDKSTSPPPTPLLLQERTNRQSQPQDKPLRSKRSHRQKTPPGLGQSSTLPSNAPPLSTPAFTAVTPSQDPQNPFGPGGYPPTMPSQHTSAPLSSQYTPVPLVSQHSPPHPQDGYNRSVFDQRPSQPPSGHFPAPTTSSHPSGPPSGTFSHHTSPPSAHAASTGANGTPQTRIGLPSASELRNLPPPSSHYDGAYSDSRPASRAQETRDEDIRMRDAREEDVNGDERAMNGDGEQAGSGGQAPPSGNFGTGTGGTGGFTAVNR